MEVIKGAVNRRENTNYKQTRVWLNEQYLSLIGNCLIRNFRREFQKLYKLMNFEWLLPEQIQQILKLCQLSSVEDPALAANVLESNHWDFEKSMHELIDQNDQIAKQKERTVNQASALTAKQEQSNYRDHLGSDEEFEMDPQDYHQLTGQDPNVKKPPLFSEHSAVLAQQNLEYEQMQIKMLQEKEKEEERQKYQQERQAEFSEGQREFSQKQSAQNGLPIKFRLAHKMGQFIFSRDDKIETIFKYVSCFLRDGFDNRYSEFDLTQNYPFLSLSDRKGEKLSEVFPDSMGELLMVKQK